MDVADGSMLQANLTRLEAQMVGSAGTSGCRHMTRIKSKRRRTNAFSHSGLTTTDTRVEKSRSASRAAVEGNGAPQELTGEAIIKLGSTVIDAISLTFI